MADQLCDICKEEPAMFLFGPLTQGAQWFGAGCMARAGLDLAMAVLDAEEIASTLGPMFVEVPKPEGQGSKRRGKRQPEPEAASTQPAAESEAAEGVEEAQAAGNDG